MHKCYPWYVGISSIGSVLSMKLSEMQEKVGSKKRLLYVLPMSMLDV